MSSQNNRDYTQGFFRGISLSTKYDFKDKKSCIQNYVAYMLCRTQSMFEYEDLPDSIPARSLELMLQTNGNVCFTRHNGELYVFTGGPGGEPNAYYMPTTYVVANPYLKLSKTYTIDKDCVVIPSDSLYLGLLPMFSKYATQLVENDLSMNIVDIMSRVVSLLSASDDRTKKSAEKYLEDIVEGKLGVIGENVMFDGIRSQPISASTMNYLVPLIEYQQYIKASWLNDIGLNANFNMKREALNSSESSLNQDALLPLIDDMLRCRKIGIEKVNAMFGTNISVKLASSWEDNQQEVEAEHEAILAEAGVVEEQDKSSDIVTEFPDDSKERTGLISWLRQALGIDKELEEEQEEKLEQAAEDIQEVVEEVTEGDGDDKAEGDIS